VGLAVLLLAAVAPPPVQAITGTGSHETGTGGGEPQAPSPPPDDPLVPMSVPPGGVSGGGDSSDPAVAGDDPEVVVFVSDDDGLTDDDANGHPDVFVNDKGVVDRVSTDPPGSTLTDVVAGPAVSSTGDVVVYGGEVLDPGSDVPVDRVVVTNRETGATELAPPPRDGGDVGGVAVSPDGSVVAWEQRGDVYLHQPGSGAPDPVLVTHDEGGRPAGGSSDPGLCAEGQRVVFATDSPLVVPGDTNGTSDVVVATGLLTPDAADDQLTRISNAAGGTQTDGASTEPAITADCTKVVFTSFATNVVPGDANATADVFLHDLTTGTTTSVTHANGPSGQGAISDDGGYVAFASAADNLVADDTNGEDPRDATPTSFQAVDRSGRLVYATSVVSVDGPRVRLGFPDTLDFATVSAGSVDGGALIDDQVLPVDNRDGRSNTNPVATLGPALIDDQGHPVPPGVDVTDGPDLSFAEVVLDDGGTPDEPADDVSVVRYCFDEAVATVVVRGDAGGTENVASDRFVLEGYNSSVRLRSVRASIEADVEGVAATCVRAWFPAGVEVPRFTGAAVLNAAVADDDGQASLQASRPLAGNAFDLRAGDVTGPNLTSAQADLVANRVTYGFDDIVVTDALLSDLAVRFAFVDGDGYLHPGRFVAAADGDTETVTVEFDLRADPVGNARRFVVLPAAVRNAAGEANVEQSTDGDVAGPELVAVTRLGPAGGPGPPRYDIGFNTEVSDADVARFVLYTEDGTGFPGESLTRPSPRLVRVSAPAVERFAGSVVLGVAQPRAVLERLVDPDGGELSGAANPMGAKGIAGRLAPPGSVTDGPDLVAVELFPEVHAVDFVFDEVVRDVHLALTRTAPGLPTDVFVRELATNHLVRASVDGNDRELAGVSSSPRISRDGRYVVFAFLPRSPDGGGRRVIFRRDLIVVRIAPSAIDFGARTTESGPSDRTRVEVANRGFGRLALRAVTLAGANPDEFIITSDRCTDRTLGPNEVCAMAVAFAPGAAGSRVGELVVAYRAPRSPRVVALTGQGLPVEPPPGFPVEPPPGLGGAGPSVTVSPGLGPPGTVALVRGEGFRPRSTVELRWAPDPGTTSTRRPLGSGAAVIADADGRFGPTPFLVLPGDVVGPRLVVVEGDQPGVSVTVPFLVVPGTVQPEAMPTRVRPPFGDVSRTLAGRRLQLVNRR
jgi:hypothetical protein